ncbi:hypothetical protein C7E16_04060 [Acinetobacter radioresistens]|uniref:hypothetical protein n=1 Tax=Acinetobacter radioresistens TaxID=40216 RepID=UPI000D0B5ACE|nr:hypothetical protein [Acinetobacter radioresistens]PSD37069.1 hypothetical protein C7E16_04060 [Acinetobacter radioresistens]PSD38760.1 hypothetical protein C7E21_07655 [Acinetobacter radioresistens]
MIEVSLTNIVKGAQKPFYAHEFETLPRIGEWINLDGQIFEVVMVIHHPSDQSGPDLYVKHLGSDIDLIDHLVRESEI